MPKKKKLNKKISIPFVVDEEIRLLISHKSTQPATDKEVIEWALMILKLSLDNDRWLADMAQYVS